MKVNKILFGLMASGTLFAGLTQSCVSDAPFADGDGEGTLRMQLVVNSDLTRAAMSEQDLNDQCVVYISGAEGLLYKYEGVGNLPEVLNLKSGHYVAEAWTGDSVPASFESRFYRGYAPFDIQNNSNTGVVLNCRIANVVVSVDQSTITPDMMTDWNVKVYNSTGELTFNEENAETAKGYFMMPNKDIAYDESGNIRKGSDDWTLYTNLFYTVEGTALDGSHFTKTGPIGSSTLEGDVVEHAHEYVLKFEYTPDHEAAGGGLITVIVEDKEILVKEEVGLYSRPSIKGVGFDIEKQITGNKGDFTEQIVKIAGFNGIKAIELSSEDYQALNLPFNGIDILNIADDYVDEVKARGLDWSYTVRGGDKADLCYLKFEPEFLNNIEERNEEYRINIHVKDGYGRVNDATVRIAAGDGAVVEDDPVTVEDASALDYLAIRATSATLSGTIVGDDVEGAGIEYRKATDSQWTFVPARLSRSGEQFTVSISGLEPKTVYQYRAKADGFQSSTVKTFTTEEKFIIPFANMETWSAANGNNAIQFPGDNYGTQFWDSGNHGSAAMSKTLTQGSTLMHNSGSKSAELKSQFVGLFGNVGKFAAGNLFVGTFGERIGTSGARLTFGKDYNGSHPDKLAVWVSYTPKKVTDAPSNPGNLTTNDYDQGQIYIAFATEPIKVNTGDQDNGGVKAGTFFDVNDPRILAYGEKTWAGGQGCGTASSLERIEIPIEWRADAKTKRATTIIIVCSASKYGDYFVGGRESIMYLDDFELIY